MVLQDTWLFAGTIRDNIAYGRPGATEEEILEAARATYVDRFVHSLPDGYDTLIDDEGSNISAGEKQLLTIARAFLADPALLILDEATSSVDTRTEVLVQHAMAALRADRTSFVIAHRLSTIRDADLILVMENGAIVEQGTHDATARAAAGRTPALYNAQFAGGGGGRLIVGSRRTAAQRGVDGHRAGCRDVTFLTVVVRAADVPVQWSKMPTNLAGVEVVAVNANDGVSPSRHDVSLIDRASRVGPALRPPLPHRLDT